VRSGNGNASGGNDNGNGGVHLEFVDGYRTLIKVGSVGGGEGGWYY
jgi:hypothetical protein